MKASTRMIRHRFVAIMGVCALAGALSAEPIRIMCIGNSITASFNNYASWRRYLWRELVDNGIDSLAIDFVGTQCGVGDTEECGTPLYDDFDMDHEAQHTMKITEMGNLMWEGLDLYQPRIVLVHLGTNDLVVSATPDDWSTDLRWFIDYLRYWTPDPTILLAQIIPSQGTMPTETYNDTVLAVANDLTTPASPIIVVDQYTGFDAYLHTFDGIHPTHTGEMIMGVKWSETLLPLLRERLRLKGTIVSLTDESVVTRGEPLEIRAHAVANRGLKEVRFYADSLPLGSATHIADSTYALTVTPATNRFLTLGLEVEDSSGRVETDSVRVAVSDNATPVDLSIMDIQGEYLWSPYHHRRVRTSGVVTYIDPDSSQLIIQDFFGDGDSTTSDALLVYLGGRKDSLPAIHTGDSLCITGVVEEYGDAPLQPVTRLSYIDSIHVIAAGHAHPLPYVVSSMHTASIKGALGCYEHLENMLVTVQSGVVVGATDNEQFQMLTTTNAQRGSGYDPMTGVLHVTRKPAYVDHNPERICIAANGYEPLPQLRVGDAVASVTGVLLYRDGMYTIVPQPGGLSASPSLGFPPSPVSSRWSSIDHGSIVTFDLGGLYDTIDAPGADDEVVSSQRYLTAIVKLAKAVEQEMMMPSLLLVQNVEHETVLHDLATRINEIHGGSYKAVSRESFAPNGLQNGFIYDTLYYSMTESHLISGSAVDSAFGPLSGNPWARPLVGEFTRPHARMTVINLSLVDKYNDTPLFGTQPPQTPSEAQRLAQARVVRTVVDSILTADPNTLLIVGGQFNDFGFSTAVATVKGNAGSGEVELTSAYDAMAESKRYTVIQEGNAQMTSHLMASPATLPYIHGADVLHFNTGFADGARSDSSTVIGGSEHDPLEIRIRP